jgi:hypothetical protein
MYCVKIKAGEDHPAVSCVIYFSVWFLNVYREGGGKCNEKCMENAWQLFLEFSKCQRLTCMKVERFLKLALKLWFWLLNICI